MKKMIPMLASTSMLVLGLISCDQPRKMDDGALNHHVDSAYAAQRPTIIDQMNRDCVDNMQARVQMKTDSLVNAAKTGNTTL